jgi:hypothetical protein
MAMKRNLILTVTSTPGDLARSADPVSTSDQTVPTYTSPNVSYFLKPILVACELMRLCLLSPGTRKVRLVATLKYDPAFDHGQPQYRVGRVERQRCSVRFDGERAVLNKNPFDAS